MAAAMVGVMLACGLGGRAPDGAASIVRASQDGQRNDDRANRSRRFDERRDGPATPRGRVLYSGAIFNRNSGRVIDVANYSREDDANIWQWEFKDTPNQLWTVIAVGGGQYAILNHGSNKVLEVQQSREADGASVVQHRWNNGDHQRWRLSRRGGDAYQILNVATGKCLDVSRGRRNDGADIQQWTCTGRDNQEWKLGR